jgi:hypothetical protein
MMPSSYNIPANPGRYPINGRSRPDNVLAYLERKARTIANNTGKDYNTVLAKLKRGYGQYLTLPEE